MYTVLTIGQMLVQKTDMSSPERPDIDPAQQLYASTDYVDELAWAAAWLYKATGTQSYLTDARNYYAKVPATLCRRPSPSRTTSSQGHPQIATLVAFIIARQRTHQGCEHSD